MADEPLPPGVSRAQTMVAQSRRRAARWGCRRWMAYRPPIRPVAWISLVVFIVSVIAGVVYLAHDRPKHGGAFISLSVVAAVGFWFTTAPRNENATC